METDTALCRLHVADKVRSGFFLFVSLTIYLIKRYSSFVKMIVNVFRLGTVDSGSISHHQSPL